MYHCHLNFYLMGFSCRAFEVIKEMAPLEHFTHGFQEAELPWSVPEISPYVIFANLQGMSPAAVEGVLAAAGKNKNQTILLMEKETMPLIAGHLSEIQDIWILPMSDDEIRFRFLRWQQSLKMSKDYWQTSQYLETTINSIPNLIWYKDKVGIHVKVNDSFCKTVNKTKQQVEGRDHYYIWDVDPQSGGADCMESDYETMRSRKTCVSEETVETGEGIRLLTTYKSPLYDIDGTVMGTVGVGIDATQERKYEKEIIAKNHTLEAIFTGLDCGVISHSLDGSQIIRINEAALKILGYESKEELCAEGFHMVAASVMDEDKPKLREAIKKLKKEGDTASVEYRVQHKNGTVVHVMGNVKLLKENGNMFYQRFLLDSTAQKLQEKENERRQMELMQALTIDYNLVFFFDLETGMGMPIRVDDDSAHIFAAGSDGQIYLKESMEQYIEEFVHESDRETMRSATDGSHLKENLSQKNIYYVNYRICRNGVTKYYEMKAVRSGAWAENHGIVLGFRSVDEETRNDMEKRKILEDALLQANKANNAKSAFLSNMSHDIRTPMNAIVGYTTLAAAHIDNQERVKDYLDKIMVSEKHLLSLINDVLDMSRIENGKLQLEETPWNLSEILHEVVNIVQADARAKGQKLQVNMTEVKDDEIYCDKLRLNQVLLNILSNSVKYTKEGGSISMTVRERAQTSAGYASYQFCIRDNGIGMSEEFLKHIFDPFEREKNTTISRIQGTGLGMALTKSLVDMMNGSINVKSQLDVGTEVVVCFSFRLRSKESEKQDNSENVSESQTHKARLYKGVRILLVEDNELNQEIAQCILEDHGFVIEIADNGKKAVDMVQNSVPGYYELVLMDIQMPVMNGYEATKEIRSLENPALSSIPILAMTANAFEEDKQRALQCGMNGHIAKPIAVDKIFSALGEVLV